MRDRLRVFLTAVTFLTRIPCRRWVGHGPEYLAPSTPYFPVVGVIVGLWGALLFALASIGWPAWVAAVISTAGTVWITGALHEDAVADAFDGFGGGWEKERILAIMKDSRVGSYGVVGLSLVLLAKLGILASLAPPAAARALVAAHALARWSSLPLLWRYGYVRETSGTGKPFAASVTTSRLVSGSAAALVAVGVALGGHPVRCLVVLGSSAAITALAGWYFHRRIGGITGDCLGVANQMVELATYLALGWRVGA